MYQYVALARIFVSSSSLSGARPPGYKKFKKGIAGVFDETRKTLQSVPFSISDSVSRERGVFTVCSRVFFPANLIK